MPDPASDRQVPAASVVIATYNRRAMLEATLDALATQVGAPPFEVVVVDDASPDDTQAMLAARAASSPYPLRSIRVEQNRGPAHARNRGWRAARGSIVCFTDDDCVPSASWVAELVRRIPDADVVQGRTEPSPAQADRRGPFSRTMVVTDEEGFYETCNIAYRRAVLERLDGFDESFRFPFGEDTDLAWRARDAGARTAFAAKALVHHEVWPSDLGVAFRTVPRIDGLVHMVAKHPALRSHVGWRRFARRTHPPALLALAAAIIVGARPGSKLAWAAAGAAGAGYAWTCRRHRPPPTPRWKWVAVVPAALLVDLAEVAVMARASARYRTLLL